MAVMRLVGIEVIGVIVVVIEAEGRRRRGMFMGDGNVTVFGIVGAESEGKEG